MAASILTKPTESSLAESAWRIDLKELWNAVWGKAPADKFMEWMGAMYQPKTIPAKSGVLVGWEWQTTQSILKWGYTTPAYSTEVPEALSANKQIDEARSYESYLKSTNVEYAAALESNPELSFWDKLNTFTSTYNDVGITKYNAIKLAEDLKDPNSQASKDLKMRIGSINYEWLQESKKETERVYNEILSNPELYKSKEIVRGLKDLPWVHSIVDWASEWKYWDEERAAMKLRAEGKIEWEGWKYYATNLLWTAIEFGWLGGLVEAAATRWLVAIWTAPIVEWTAIGARIAKAWIQIDQIATASPMMFAMTVDNGFTSAIQYSVDEAFGSKTSNKDFANNLVMGVLAPPAITWVLKWGVKAIELAWSVGKWAKWVTTRDLKNLDKAIKDEMTINWATTPEEAFNNIGDSFKFEDWTTLTNKKEEYIKTTPKNPDGVITWEEIQANYSKNNKVSMSKRASKKLAKVVTELNSEISKEWGVADGAYWTLSKNDKISMAKQDIVNELEWKSIITWKDVDDAIETAFTKQWLEFKSSYKAIDDAEDAMDEVYYNTAANPKLADEATTLSDIGKALWSEKKFSSKDIEWMRYGNLADELDTTKLQEIADENWVKINPNKLYESQPMWVTTKPKINKKYVASLLDEIELAHSWYSKTKSTIISSFKSKVKKVTNVLKWIITSEDWDFKIWTINDVVKKLKADMDSLETPINKLVSEAKVLSDRIRTITSAAEKQKLIKQKSTLDKRILEERAKWNSRVADVKKKIDELKNFTRYMKDSIDMGIEQYKTHLPPAQLTAIKNKYKAKINPNTTVKRGIEIMNMLSEELHLANFKKLEADADGLVARINKRAKTKSKKANMDISVREELIRAYGEFNSSRVNKDIKWMREAVGRLHNIEEFGRNLYKQNQILEKEWTKIIIAWIDNWLRSIGKTRLEIQRFGSDTSEIWLSSSNALQNMITANIPANLQLDRMVRDLPEPARSQFVKVFIDEFHMAINRHAAKKSKVNDFIIPKILSNATNIPTVRITEGGNKITTTRKITMDEASLRTDAWLLSKSNFGKENGVLTDVFLIKWADGKYEFAQWDDSFRVKYSNELATWDVIHVGSNDFVEKKTQILEDIYSEMDLLYETNLKFKEWVDELRGYFNWEGEKIQIIWRDKFDKVVNVDPNYYPIQKMGKWGSDWVLDSNWEYAVFVQDTLNDWFLVDRVPPSGMVKRRLWLAEVVANHVEGAGYYTEMVNPLLNANAIYRKLQSGRVWIGVDIPSNVTMGDVNAFWVDVEGKQFIWPWNQLISDDVSRFMKQYLAMMATNGRSLGWGPDWAKPIVNTVVSISNNVMLSWPWTALKQPMVAWMIPFRTSVASTESAVKSMTSSANRDVALDSSAILMERQAQFINREGTWKQFRLQWGKNVIVAWAEKIGNVNQFLSWNSVKAFDWFMSMNAWLAWVSEHLHDNLPALHTKWSYMNLASIKTKILAMDWGEQIWEEVVNGGNKYMAKIMGSNQLTSKSVGAWSTIGKLMLLFQKTWLNQMVSIFDKIWEDVASRPTALGKWLQRGVSSIGALWVMAFAYAYASAVDEAKVQVSKTMGIKKEEELDNTIWNLLMNWSSDRKVRVFWVEVKNPKYEDIIKSEVSKFLGYNLVSPWRSLDLFGFTSSATAHVKKAISAPTIEWKIVEWVTWVAKLGFNGNYVDYARAALAKTWLIRTQVEQVEWNDAAKQVVKQYEWGTIDITKSQEFDWMVSQQIRVNRYNEEQSKLEKPIKEAEEKFIKDLSNKYWTSMSVGQFINEFNKSKDSLPKYTEGSVSDQNRKAKSLYWKVLLQSASTSNQRDSILMGLDLQTIYDLEIKSLAQSKWIEAARQRVIELSWKWAIKSRKWVEDIGIMLMKDGLLKKPNN